MPRPVALSALLERLRAALLPELDIEREVASGGMGTVFLARDPVLARHVAVKILRPELVTARAAERFLAEARTLASLSHPNIVPIHTAGEAGGFSYYVMDFVEGPTLAARLADGPLPPRAAVRMGEALLDALATVHAAGVIHRDIKPANVFFHGDRALLGDFGLAVSGVTVASDGHGQGTPKYMAPEQLFGGSVSARTDLYAVGLVLYEAFTGHRPKPQYGHRWSGSVVTEWTGVPRGILPVLRRALQTDPEDRWPDAASFRRALHRAATAPRRRRAYLGTAGIAALGIAGALLVPRGSGPDADVAILPFAVQSGLDPQWETHLPALAAANLEVLRVAPSWSVLRERVATAAGAEALYRRLHTRWLVSGTVGAAGDTLIVRLVATSARGTRRESAEIRMHRDEMDQIGSRLGFEIVTLVNRDLRTQYRPNVALQGAPAEAVRLWLEGERAFQLQAWSTAESLYRQALDLDASFPQAQWGLVNARRWLRTMSGEDVERLWRQHAGMLAERDRLLLEADLTPDLTDRFAKYEAMLDPARYGQDAYVWLLYGTEVFHRGPLVGVPLDSAVRLLERSVALDSTFAPTYLQLAWALIRLGRHDEARAAVSRLHLLSGPQAAVPSWFLELAYCERFAPDSAAAFTQQLLEGGRSAGALEGLAAEGLRWGTSLGVPHGQEAIATLLLEIGGDSPAVKAQAFEARGLARLALGRLADAVADLDSAAAWFGTPEARLQALQWRVLLNALGPRGSVPADEVVRARRGLAALAEDAALGSHAAWTMALDAYLTGNTAAGDAWAERMRGGSASWAPNAGSLLDAIRHAVTGDVRMALSIASGIVPRSFLSDPEARRDERLAIPFFRSTLYLLRAQWREALGDDRAAREWLWHENSDLVGWPSGPAQAGEIDWTHGTYATARRARLALARGDTRSGCALLSDVRETWRAADPAVRAVVETEPLFRERCR